MKKFALSFLIFSVILSLCLNVYGFTFPEPDWGALLKDKQRMVDEKDFQLYAEGSSDSAPYYGAKFEPREGVYIGSIAENSGKIQPLSAYLTYVEHMYQDDLYYPANQMIRDDRVIPMIGWSIHDLNSIDYYQVRKVLDNLNSYNKPMFIRFANEMNVSALGDNPEQYKEIFRKVADMIHEYPNFAVVWSPNDMGALDRPFEYFYPGDEYVDWIGVSCYSIRYFLGNPNTSYKESVYFMTGDYAWATNRVKPIVEFMEKNNIKKPLMVSEGGVATNTKYGEDLSGWASPRLRNMFYSLIMRYPQIKMINYFDTHRAGEDERFDITNYSYAVDIFNEAKNSGAYITEYGNNARFSFVKADNSGVLTSNNGVVNLYTLAHFPGHSDIHVNYYVDGEWKHASGNIPYKYDMNISGISDGIHELTVSTLDEEIKKTFYKKGNTISFTEELAGTPSAGSDTAIKNEVVNVVINGKKMMFDPSAIIKDSRTLVPLRGIFEELGASVEWDGATSTVTATRGNIIVKLTIGDNKMYKNGSVIELDVSAQLIDERTFVPVRAVAEAFEAIVRWNAETQTVIING